MPKAEWFEAMCNAYGLDSDLISSIENKWGLKKGMVLCITVAETSWWTRGRAKSNPWNVWNNDRWDRVAFDSFEKWLNAIGQTLNNVYLWEITTLGCLSNGWNCQGRDDNWKRYATSDGNWERNMVACLGQVYGAEIDASEWAFRL